MIAPDRAALSALIERLETLAKAATPGPWEYARGKIRGFITHAIIAYPDVLIGSNGFVKPGGPTATANAAFIAACHPETILTLCAALKARLA